MLLKAYFFLFNLASAAGWAYCWYLTAMSYSEQTPLWDTLAQPLTITQSLALFEVLHSLLGMTKSPFMQTALQVTSRILLVYGFTIPSKSSQDHWSLYLMAFCWATTEVPRYLFYAFKQLMNRPPAILFSLRYSLFYVMYPAGISGEMMQMFVSLPKALQDSWMVSNFMQFPDVCLAGCKACENNMGCLATVIILILYVLGGPLMVFLMHLTRKGAYRRRYPRKIKPDLSCGILFPEINGNRSTSEAGKCAVSAAISAGAPAPSKEGAACRMERNWRFKYVKHFKNLVLTSLESPERAVKVAEAGAGYMHSQFEFRREKGGPAISLKKEMERKDTCLKGTCRIKGEGKKIDELTVPYNGRTLSKEALINQADKWASYGTIEADAAESIKQIVSNPSLLNLQKHYFVLIGTGSAMGPFLKLMELGANIIALDIPGAWGSPKRPSIWNKLIKVARGSGGRMIFPLNKPASECKNDDQRIKAAGANLMEQPCDILNWLMNLDEVKDPNNQIVIGNYTYLDGARHVKLSVCADAIMKAVVSRRPKGKTSLAYLCTPTDMHVITPEASKAAERGILSNILNPISTITETVLHKLSGGKFLRNNVWRAKNSKGKEFNLVDGLSVAQGPNYALAKRLQHWRAILAYEQGAPVSTNVAPSTATLSVVKARTFAWAYKGMPYFKPYEIFEQDTTNAVMTAALIYDIRNPNAASKKANRNKKATKVENPLELFMHNSFHGGVWRAPYKVDSIGETSVLIYFMGGPMLFLPVSVALGGALAAGAYTAAAAFVPSLPSLMALAATAQAMVM